MPDKQTNSGQPDMPRALLIGCSRGLGLGLAHVYSGRGWDVVAVARDPEHATALAELAKTSGVRMEQADVLEPEQMRALHERLATERFALVFIIAGIADIAERPLHDVPPDDAARVFLTNAYAPLCFAEAFADLLTPGGTIALMSSAMGSVGGESFGGWEVYRASKAALNMLTRCFAERHQEDGSTILLVHPGSVHTDMGPGAPLDVETSTIAMYDLLAAQAGTGGCRFLDYQGNALPW